MRSSGHRGYGTTTFDVFNHPNLANPNLNVASANFGQIVNRTGNRRVQLGIEMYF